MRALWRLARRFVAGETLGEALPAVRELNRRGLLVTLDILGEHVTSPEVAARAAAAYEELLDRIAAEKLRANVSIKLTQMGLDIDDEVAYRNARRIVARAAEHGNFVRIDMEGSAYTDRTLAVFRRLFRELPNVGIVIQAMLRRSEADVRALLELGARIRLVKGAYKEPARIAYRRMADIRRNFIHLLELLFASGLYHAVATHDERLIRWTLDRVAGRGPDRDGFEFQMLYGMRRERQLELVRAGYRMRTYVPYGTHWLPYFWRRLRERKENLYFVLRYLFTHR